jgi:hypothetical protein
MTYGAVSQRNYYKNNTEKGLCGKCPRPLCPRSVCYCEYHLKLKIARTMAYSKKPEYKEASKARYADYKSKVIEAFGGVCFCCGESEPEFLTLDHIANDGFLETKGLMQIFRNLIKEGFPKNKFQLACYNCNCGRAKNKGICPHKEKK